MIAPGTRICVGRAHLTGIVTRVGPIGATVRLDGDKRDRYFLLSSCKPLPTPEEKIVQLPLPK